MDTNKKVYIVNLVESYSKPEAIFQDGDIAYNLGVYESKKDAITYIDNSYEHYQKVFHIMSCNYAIFHDIESLYDGDCDYVTLGKSIIYNSFGYVMKITDYKIEIVEADLFTKN